MERSNNGDIGQEPGGQAQRRQGEVKNMARVVVNNHRRQGDVKKMARVVLDYHRRQGDLKNLARVLLGKDL